jgi:hypothetical protein
LEWVKVIEKGGFPHSRVQGLSSKEIHEDLTLIRHQSVSDDQSAMSEEDVSEEHSHRVDSSTLVSLEASPLKDTLTLSSEASQPDTLAMDEDDVFHREQGTSLESMNCNAMSMTC